MHPTEDQTGSIDEVSSLPPLADGLLVHVDATAQEVRQALNEDDRWTAQNEVRFHYAGGVAIVLPLDYTPEFAFYFSRLPASIKGTVVQWAFVLGENGEPEALAGSNPERIAVSQEAFWQFQTLCAKRGWKVTMQS